MCNRGVGAGHSRYRASLINRFMDARVIYLKALHINTFIFMKFGGIYLLFSAPEVVEDGLDLSAAKQFNRT